MNDFDQWYSFYPRKIARGQAQKAYEQAIKKGYSPEDLLVGCQAFAAMIRNEKTAQEFIPYPATWLRAERWLDENLVPAHIPTPDEIAANIDRADRLFRRGKYAEKYQ
jgi:hypothetical protein